MKLNYKRTFLIGFAFMSICSFWQLYDNEIPLILKNTFHLKETITGVIMAMDNVLALFLLPLFGALSDRANTKIGKRTPFILVGTALAVVSMMLIPAAAANKSLVMLFISLGFVLVCMGTYRSPAVALMPDLTPKPLRSKANAIINLMGTLGGIYTLLMTMLISKMKNYELPLFLSVAAIMVLSVIVLFVTVREKKLAEQLAADPETAGTVLIPEEEVNVKNKNKLPRDVFTSLCFLLASVSLWFIAYNGVTTAFSRYTQQVWKVENAYSKYLMVATIAATLSYFPIAFISSSIGRKKTILAGIVLMFLSFFCAYFILTPSPMMYVFFATTGIGWASINVNSYPMVVEMSHYGDIGKYTGIYYTFSMSAQILTPILSGFLIEKISYRILFPYAAIFMCLALITMLFVRHGDSRPPKKGASLECLDVDD